MAPGEPQRKGAVSQNKEHKCAHKEKLLEDTKDDENSPAFIIKKSHKLVSKEESQRQLSGIELRRKHSLAA